MEDAGKASVIVTCFNGARWIRRALDSAFAQTYEHREIIAVDDGSGDDSRRILETYRGRPGFRIVLHAANLGIPATKNSGLRHARGEYVAYLEQDDEWLPDKLEAQVRALRADPELGLVFAAAICVEESGREYLRRHTVSIPAAPREAAVEAIFRWNPVISMSSVMMRRACLEALGGFDERYSGADDYDLWLRFAGSYQIAHLDRPLVRYYAHRESYSRARADRMLSDRLAIVDAAVGRHPLLGPLRRRRRASVLLASAASVFADGASRLALRYAGAAWREAPGLATTYAALPLFLSGGLGRRALKLWRRVARWRSA